MKFATYYIALASLMGVMTMSGCANNDVEANDTQKKVVATTFGVSLPNTDSRVALTDQDPNGVKFAWAKDDQIGIMVANINNTGGVNPGTNGDHRQTYAQGSGTTTVTPTGDIGLFQAHLNSGENTASGSFGLNGYSLDYTKPSYYLFYGFYPPSLTVKNLDVQTASKGPWKDMSYVVDYSATQKGTLADVQSRAVMVGFTGGGNDFSASKISLKNVTSILRLKLNFGVDLKNITGVGVGGPLLPSGDLDIIFRTKETMYIRSDGATTDPTDITTRGYLVTFDTPQSTTNKELTVYLAVLPQTCTESPVIKVTSNGHSLTYSMKQAPTFVAGKVHTITAQMVPPDDAAPVAMSNVSVGDVIYSDGTCSPYEYYMSWKATNSSVLTSHTPVGICIYTGEQLADADDNANKRTYTKPSTFHGYMIALSDAASGVTSLAEAQTKAEAYTTNISSFSDGWFLPSSIISEKLVNNTAIDELSGVGTILAWGDYYNNSTGFYYDKNIIKTNSVSNPQLTSGNVRSVAAI